jgi:hypothetical protein
MGTANPATRPPTAEPSVDERVRTELREYAITALYLFVWLGALLLYRAAVLGEAGAIHIALALAAGKALILGKFVLIGEHAGVGSRFGARTLLQRIGAKAVSFLLLLVVLSLIEELVVGRVHGRSFAQTLAEYEARSLLELLMTCFLMLLVLVPFVSVREVSRALGPGVLRRMLLEPSKPGASSETR